MTESTSCINIFRKDFYFFILKMFLCRKVRVFLFTRDPVLGARASASIQSVPEVDTWKELCRRRGRAREHPYPSHDRAGIQ